MNTTTTNKQSPLERKPRPATQKMVAREAGVSQETVSHILGGRGDRYHSDTRAKVVAAAQRLNYRPHRGAQMMRTGRSKLIGIVHFGSPYETARQMARFLPAEIKALGYRTLVIDLSWQGHDFEAALGQLVEARVEGVIVTQMIETFGKAEVEFLKRAGIPVITISGNEKLGVPAVHEDTHGAAAMLTQHLLQLGHRRIALLTAKGKGRPIESRIAGFKSSIRTAGGGQVISVGDDPRALSARLAKSRRKISGWLIEIDADRELEVGAGAYCYARALFATGALPDALLCTNDFWARGVFAAALEAGVRIPEDLAVAGYDDEPFGAYAPYYLTTVAHPRAEECQRAAEILIDLIEGRTPSKERVFPCRLIVRRSCGGTAARGKEELALGGNS